MTNERREAVSITLPRRLLQHAMAGCGTNRSRRLAQLIQRGLEAEGRVSRPSFEELETLAKTLGAHTLEVVETLNALATQLGELSAGVASTSPRTVAKTLHNTAKALQTAGVADQLRETARALQSFQAERAAAPAEQEQSPVTQAQAAQADPAGEESRKNVNEDPFDKYPWARRLKEVVHPDGTREYVPVDPPPDKGTPAEWKEWSAKSAKELL